MTLEDGAIERILTAVGNHGPADLDRDQLRADLEGVASFYRTGRDVRNKPARRRQDLLEMIARVKALQADLGHPDLHLRFLRHASALNPLIADLQDELKSAPALARMLGVHDGSAFDNLVGHWLREVFERHFCQPATSGTRSAYTDDITGRFIDFVEVVLKELKITYRDQPYARSAIARAVTKAVNG